MNKHTIDDFDTVHKFIPAPTKMVTVIKQGGITEQILLNRKQRRRIGKQLKVRL